MNSLKIYSYLENLPTRLSYSAKLMGAAMFGAIVQCMVLAAWALTGELSRSPSLGAIVVLGAGLLMTGVSLWVIWNLLKPLGLVVEFLEKYSSNGEISDLPSEFQDEVGVLMRQTRNTVVNHDRTLREFQHKSKIDALTGLYNRQFSSERLQQDLARANRSQVPVSMIVVDIDEFRRLNDVYGTAVGDACLQHFAGVASSSIREGDWIGRWGADEFLVVLWGADSEIAEAVIWRIKRNLAASNLAHEAGIRLTASYGFATHMPGQLDFEFVNKASAALQSAKRQGRNRVAGAPAGVR